MRLLAITLFGCGSSGFGPAPERPGTDPSPVPDGPMALCINEIAPAAARSWRGDDWIELFDPTGEVVSLEGWGLADADGVVHPLPEGSVPAGGAIVLDGDRLPIGLDADGDEVVLVDPEGRRQVVRYGPSERDRTWARTEDCCTEAGCWTSVWLGTPARSNGRQVVGPDTPPEWTTPVNATWRFPALADVIELTVEVRGGARAWLDGEELLRVGLPSGEVGAEDPPLLDAPTVARVRVVPLPIEDHVLVVQVHGDELAVTAQALGDGPSSLASQGEEDVPAAPDVPVFARDRIHEIRLELGPEAQATMDAEVGTYVTGVLTYDGQVLDRIAVKRRGKGGSLRPMGGKPKLRVDLNREVPGGGLGELKALILDNAVQDCSSIKMPLAFDVFALAGNAAPRSGYAHVVIDGEDKGLYYLTEEIDERFAEVWTGDPDAAVFDGSYANKPGEPLALADFDWETVDRFDQEEGPDLGGAQLDRIVEALDAWEAGTATVQDVAQVLDWDSWIGHLAAEEWVGHADGYVLMPNNEWIVIPADGRSRVVAWDTDQTFVEDWQWFIGTRWNDPGGRIARLCVADPTCAERKRQVMANLMDAVDAADLHGELDRLSALTLAATRADPRRECAVESVDVFRAAVGAWIDERSSALRGVYGL
ncbi:MAG: CotH kinase family protein [Alphaproteobacteria bacterium]|nr:CotH kinase family protein [Alphaproteobacteria bacterium]